MLSTPTAWVYCPPPLQTGYLLQQCNKHMEVPALSALAGTLSVVLCCMFWSGSCLSWSAPVAGLFHSMHWSWQQIWSRCHCSVSCHHFCSSQLVFSIWFQVQDHARWACFLKYRSVLIQWKMRNPTLPLQTAGSCSVQLRIHIVWSTQAWMWGWAIWKYTFNRKDCLDWYFFWTTWGKSLWMFLVSLSAFWLELWARAHLSLTSESSSITAPLFDLAFVFPWVVENPAKKKAQHWQRFLARLYPWPAVNNQQVWKLGDGPGNMDGTNKQRDF